MKKSTGDNSKIIEHLMILNKYYNYSFILQLEEKIQIDLYLLLFPQWHIRVRVTGVVGLEETVRDALPSENLKTMIPPTFSQSAFYYHHAPEIL